MTRTCLKLHRYDMPDGCPNCVVDELASDRELLAEALRDLIVTAEFFWRQHAKEMAGNENPLTLEDAADEEWETAIEILYAREALAKYDGEDQEQETPR